MAAGRAGNPTLSPAPDIQPAICDLQPKTAKSWHPQLQLTELNTLAQDKTPTSANPRLSLLSPVPEYPAPEHPIFAGSGPPAPWQFSPLQVRPLPCLTGPPPARRRSDLEVVKPAPELALVDP